MTGAIRYGKGITANVGNYESVRVYIEIEEQYTVNFAENSLALREQTLARVKQYVEEKLDQALAEEVKKLKESRR